MSKRALKSISLFLFAVSFAVAPVQAQKIGYTNQQAILSNMPEMEKVQKKLKEAARQQRKEIQEEREKLQKKMKQYRQQRSLLDDSARAQREQALRRQQQELQQSSRKRQQKLRQRERELMQPLLKDLQSAINIVADRNNIDVVMRSQALLYVDQNSDRTVDITSEVAQELGINLDQTATEPSPTVDPEATPTPTGGGGQ